MELKHCDRCKLAISDELAIGITLEIKNYRPIHGVIRPQLSLRDAAKMEYFPFIFKEEFGGAVDLCNKCFTAFMQYAKPAPLTP